MAMDTLPSEMVEGVDVEAKLAGGRDGGGEFPTSALETYSAFANTDGGVILLGVKELPDGRLQPVGVANPEKVLKELWAALNNPQQVNVNLLADKDVKVVNVGATRIIAIQVPRADRKRRPVYLRQNPLNGTYRRNNDGDFRCTPDEVRRMLAEQVEDSRDSLILDKYSHEDLDPTTFVLYRKRYQARSPDHPWNELSNDEFLRSIGGWARDRDTGKSGITAAGLLMFGRLVSIKEVFPLYMLDYQERPEARTEARWIDRLTTDGSWSGNLFDFYRQVIVKLFRDLRVPFLLNRDTRVDETPVHEALREALINTLIHADYSQRVSILVVKRPDLFGFRNPGKLRLPIDQVMSGGISDCRNRRLQDMFRYVGLGEHAGSGIPRVIAAWKGQHWRTPELIERSEPVEQTLLTLRMASLLPEQTMRELEHHLGDTFRQATEIQKIALVTAALEHSVTHSRLRSMSDLHPRDITLALSQLVQRGALETEGTRKQTSYHLPWVKGQPPSLEFDENGGLIVTAISAIDEAAQFRNSPSPHAGPVPTEHKPPSSEHKPPSSEHKPPSSEHKPPGSEHSGGLDRLIDTPGSVSNQDQLERISAPMRDNKRVSPEVVKQILVALCAIRPLSLPELAALTQRKSTTLRVHYIADLVKDGTLRLRYPSQPTHPNQAYFTPSNDENSK